MTAALTVHPLTSTQPDLTALQERVQELVDEMASKYGLNTAVHAVVSAGETDAAFTVEVTAGGFWVGQIVVERKDRLRISEDEVEEFGRFGHPHGYPPEMVGAPYPFVRHEFKQELSDEHFDAMNLISHEYWVEPDETPAAIIISGLVAAAIAEQVDGRLAGETDAFDLYRHGETAGELLQWWVDTRIGWFGTLAFTNPRDQQQKPPTIV